jgi:hypothetical protein
MTTAPRWKNGVGKRCGCANRPNCDCWYSIRKQFGNKKAAGTVPEFAFLLEPHEQLPVTRLAVEVLASRVFGWLVKGKPAPTPVVPVVVEKPVELTGNDLFDRWIRNAEPFDPTGKKTAVIQNWDSKLKRARAAFGHLPISELGDPITMRQFVKAELAEGKKLATPNRILATIVRPAVLWANAQKPALIVGSPFGKYGYKIDLKKEERRTSRIDPALEYELLDICELLNTEEREYAGGILADFLKLGIDTGGRHEYFLLQNKHVDWQAHKLALLQTKNGEPRFVPFNPKGRVAALLQRRRFAGPEAYVLARPDGSPVVKVWKTWVEVVCILKKIPYVCTRKGVDKDTAAAYKACKLVPYLTRHEAATWWGEKGVSDPSAKFIQGHSSQYDTHGRYKHEQYAIARKELADKVWPYEGERDQPADGKKKRRKQ